MPEGLDSCEFPVQRADSRPFQQHKARNPTERATFDCSRAFLSDGCLRLIVRLIGKLMPFRDRDPQNELTIPANLQDYLEVVDWTGCCLVPDKRRSIQKNLPPILSRLHIHPEHRIKFIQRREKSRFHFFIGPEERIREVAETLNRNFLKGQAAASALFSLG